MTFEAVLGSGALELGLGLGAVDLAAFRGYYETLEAWNGVMNLTAIRGEREVAELHFLDSLALLTLPVLRDAPLGAALIDVGSGAGFPGLPLAIARRDLAVTLLDARAKRVQFLEAVAARLNLTDRVTCVHGRAEEVARLPDTRGAFDFAAARAVSDLRELAELTLPFVRVGGYFLAMKGDGFADSEELKLAENTIHILGGEAADIVRYLIPGTDCTRCAVVIAKVADTPPEYPRKYKKLQTKPL
ncbi:MAG: 16S rRNA (guanine(527)-N(7))-methyltransferase RsmG [Oscillospiraceae bacterium]|jgi:16S rRNA (guanine527-N7)-methyltransferase|nr:16S rRNA (guanine(527)-N(7))-methyltransferase RsmG [Oscillospiraceae bacterium]